MTTSSIPTAMPMLGTESTEFEAGAPMANIVDAPSFTGVNRETWKEEFVHFLKDQRFTHGLTVSWNANIPMSVAREHLKQLHARVDRKLLGPRFAEKPSQVRSLALFAFEKIDLHIHCHSLWRLQSRNFLKFARLFPKDRGGVWNQIAPSGSYALAIMDDWRTFGEYMLKEQHMNSDSFSLVWSDEFLPVR